MNLKTVRAKDIMTDIVVLIHQEATIKDAAHLMLRDRVSGLPVINKNNEIVGILTLTDLLKLVDKISAGKEYDFLEEILHCKNYLVSDLMTKSVFSIAPAASLLEIVKIMAKEKIHTFPVMDGGKLIGIIGRRDILNAIFTFS